MNKKSSSVSDLNKQNNELLLKLKSDNNNNMNVNVIEKKPSVSKILNLNEQKKIGTTKIRK